MDAGALTVASKRESAAARGFQPSRGQLAAIKVLLFTFCLAPLTHFAWGTWQDTLGANPIEAIIRGLGDWGLRFLLITLAVTPLRRVTGWNWLVRLRRMLGLFAFFYITLHWTSYLWLDKFFDWHDILKDIVKRPFITVGFAAFCLLVPLAATSTNAMMRRLGGKRWQWLHRAIYPIGVLAVLHFWWMVKLDITEPAIYAIVLTGLLGIRVLKKRHAASQFSVPSGGSRFSRCAAGQPPSSAEHQRSPC